MNHLDNITLNLYLDNALDANGRASADAHLANCDNCQRELAALRALINSFGAWRAEPIPRDVSAQVLTRIARRPAPSMRSRWGAAILGIQVLFVALLLIWVLPTLLRVVSGVSIGALPRFDPGLFTNFSALANNFALPIPPLAFWVWAPVVFGVAIVWLIGNRLIFTSLKHRQEASQ